MQVGFAWLPASGGFKILGLERSMNVHPVSLWLGRQ